MTCSSKTAIDPVGFQRVKKKVEQEKRGGRKMNEYDIVVVGGGPAGCSAARSAAQNGAKVLILEEHPVIGIPSHCSGMFADSGYTKEIRALLGDDKFVIRNLEKWRVYGPSGKVIQEFPLGDRGACAINRDQYDKELAKLAAVAGADIRVNTKVTHLLKEKGKIVGVGTSSVHLPEVHCKIVIVAGGYHDLHKGLVKQEGFNRPDETWGNGIQLELTPVEGMEPGVPEFYTGSIVGGGKGLGWVTMYPLDEKTCRGSLSSLAVLDMIKAGNHVLSRKLKRAQIIKMTGFVCPIPMGRGLSNYVRDGLMVIGSAANFNGNIVAFITGRWAGEVAAEAIKEGDISEGKLSKYVTKFRGIDLEHEYDYWISFLPKVRQLTDEPLEEMLNEMVKRGEKIMTRVQLPF
jgi:digeranylgeranylglycerophospholipid reductase